MNLITLDKTLLHVIATLFPLVSLQLNTGNTFITIQSILLQVEIKQIALENLLGILRGVLGGAIPILEDNKIALSFIKP